MRLQEGIRKAPTSLWMAIALYVGGTLLGLVIDLSNGRQYQTDDGQVFESSLLSTVTPLILSVLFSLLLLRGSRVIFILVALSSFAMLFLATGIELELIEKLIAALMFLTMIFLSASWRFFFKRLNS